jgi:membrane protease YdiL (CAAX protease family)
LAPVTSYTVFAVRAPFRSFGDLGVRMAVVLLLVFSVVRVALVLEANASGSYSLVSLVFVAMAVLPWVLLTADGRRRIGVTRPSHWWLIPIALVGGAAACLLLAAIVGALWGQTISNPFVYIAGSYGALPSPLQGSDRFIFFLVFASIGATFSPIGEELFYRGLVHEGLATGVGHLRASLVDAAAFALVHLSHFGVVFVAGAWALLPLPALLWVAAMFAVALLFRTFRVITGSIWGAVFAHAGFNIAMTAVIFFALGVL